MLCDKAVLEDQEGVKFWYCDQLSRLPSVNRIGKFNKNLTLVVNSDDKDFWVDEFSESTTRVNFCPVCGIKAPSQFVIKDE